MSHTPMPSRRKALQFLAGMPLLPLGASASAASVLAACGGGSDGALSSYASTSFSSMAAPTLAQPAAMATTTVGSTMSVKFTNGSAANYQLAYQPFFMTGDQVPSTAGGTILAGGYFDINNKPIIDASVIGLLLMSK